MKIVHVALIAALTLSEAGIATGLALAAERSTTIVATAANATAAAASFEVPSPSSKQAATKARSQDAPAAGDGRAATGSVSAGAAQGAAARPAAQRATRAVVPMTPAERELLAHLVHAEAGNQPLSGRVAVAAVVLNRVKSGRFGHTVADVIYAPGEFESVGDYFFTSESPTAEDRKAVDLALEGVDPSHGALYFFEPSKTASPFLWSLTLTARIGAHFFGR